MQRVLHGLPKRDWHLCQKVVKTGWFLPRRRYASSGISGHRMSVRLSHATIVPKRLYVGSWTQHHLIAQGLVFWRQQSLVDAPPPFLWNLCSKWPTSFWTQWFRPISAHSASTVRASEKSSISTNRKSTTRFPTSHRWTVYVIPKSTKGWHNTILLFCQ